MKVYLSSATRSIKEPVDSRPARVLMSSGPSQIPDRDAVGYALLGLELVNTRAGLLSTGSLIDRVALDKYTFIRDAYLAQRRDALYDGAPPMETFSDESADPKAAKPTTTPTPK